MDSEIEQPLQTSATTRHKCSACYKQYKKKEHLVTHMKVSYHSVHHPKCGVCQKQCKSFESLREHITGPLPKADCFKVFLEQGCNFCMKIFDSPDCTSKHKESCQYSGPAPLGTSLYASTETQIDNSGLTNGNLASRRLEAIAMDCEMVGGGSDGTLDLCARVCLIGEDENIIFHTYVRPQDSITDYRSDLTGITEEHLRDAKPLKEVQKRILEILYNGEAIGRMALDNGKARLLVGHDLEHDLDALKLSYPDHLLRDTAKYKPLMKTNFVSHSLKYLTRTYLGYEIQTGVHDPYEDCVSVMRLYKKMRDQEHPGDDLGASSVPYHTQSFISIYDSCRSKELMKMTPAELLKISKSNYRCWCMDLRQPEQANANGWGTW